MLFYIMHQIQKETTHSHCVVVLLKYCFRIIMNYSWMKADRLGQVYEKGFLEFLEYTEQNIPNNNGLFYCPCVI